MAEKTLAGIFAMGSLCCIFIALALIVSIPVYTAFINMQTITITNITISEKYSRAYSTPNRVVDSDGNLFVVADDNMWALLLIGKTYQVGYVTDNYHIKYISTVGFDGKPLNSPI